MAALVCRSPPPFMHFIPTLGYFGMRFLHTGGYYWNHLVPCGTRRVLLDVPYPQYLKCMAALVCRSPPLFIHFIPMPWAVLACVAILHSGGYYWNHLEPCGTPRILLDVPYPQYLTCMAALVCRSPPLFIHFIPMPWAVLACVAILHSGGYYWNHLEPCGTPRILLDVPYPQYLTCMAALVCRFPPFSYILFPCCGVCWSGCALPPEPMRYHFHPFSPILPTTGNYRNHTTLGVSWICPTPSTYALSFSLLLKTIGAIWNLYDPSILLGVP